MAWNDWLQLDNECARPLVSRPSPYELIQCSPSYRKTLEVRRRRTLAQDDEGGEMATGTLPGYRLHALEGLAEMCSFLAARHPTLYKVTRANYDAEKPETHGDSLVGDAGGAVRSIRNCVTGDYWDFDELDRQEPDWNPMKIAGCESTFTT